MLAMLRPLEAAASRPLQRCVTRSRVRARSIGQVVETGQFTAAAKLHQRHLFPGPRFESNGGTGRNIKPHPESGGSIELHRLVDFEEMEVRADLDRAIAGVAGLQFDRAAAGVEGNAAIASGDGGEI